jgi:hypothetical protein
MPLSYHFWGYFLEPKDIYFLTTDLKNAFILFYFGVLVFELRASHLLGRHSTT